MIAGSPLLGGLADFISLLVGHGENAFDGGFKGGRRHEEVRADMSRFGFWGADENSPVRANQFIHGWPIGCENEGPATHRFDNVVAPSF